MRDSWRNDIAGKGMLTKQGSGSLVLAGANSYSGGTVIEAGSLIAGSAAALGAGDVYVAGGALDVGQAGVAIKGGYTQLDGATLSVAIASADRAAMTVDGEAAINGVLDIRVPVATAGAVLQVISAKAVTGRFMQVLVNGQPEEASYSQTSVSVALGG